MFILHSSNKTENLVEHLVSVISNAPLSSPFAKEVFLIQSQGMERWLSQQLASRFHVWANYQFLFPGKFFSFIAQRIDSKVNDAAFDRSVILWRLEALLRNLENADCLPLKQYLSGTNQALKRYQLAQQLAQVFDQYQIMRPDLLAAWQSGRLLYDTDVERWQKALWHQLTAQIGQKHRGALWLDVIAKLNNAAEGALSQQLPERISVFGVNTMPPLFLDYLQSLAKHCDVHLYLLNPAQTFWADLASKRQLSTDDDYNGHPLLVSLGQQGREFQEMLLEFTQFDFEPESFETVALPNNLQQLQNDILNNAVSGQTLGKDGSISVHACHSRKREVEILRNQLLQALENDTTLELRDIAVMAPDIQLYEPFISSVFSDIQHAIADRSLRLDNQALDTFIRFLDLSQSRLGWQSVLDLLERADVFPTFDLSETDLELIKHWIQDTNVRWGQSGKHKKELGLPELNEHTWQAALDRMLMGYAVGHEDEFVDDVLPYKHIEGSSADALGGLHDFLQLLFRAKAELKQAKTLKSWGAQLYFYADQLLGKSDLKADLVERQQLNELLLELSGNLAEVHSEPVELQVIIQWLEGMVAERKSANGFLRGQLTFCSMLPMRSIPFKIIALMGINEGEFPKVDRKPTFDLIALNFRKGDRSRRADDRYQFLEILLSARQQLIITYIGQSQANNEAIPPSVIVTELLDVLRDYYQLSDLITHHPLQPFSKRYFDGTSDLSSFSEADCDIAKALSAPKPEPTLWWQGAIQAETEETIEDVIELSDLFRFFQHPQRYFMRQQLHLRYTGIIAETQEREPFTTNELSLYDINQDWVRQLLTDSEVSLKKLQAQGLWLPGAAGDVEFGQHQLAMQEFVERIRATNIGQPLDDLAVDLKIGGYRLVGTLGNRYQNGSLHYRYANLKGKDFITAWLLHLLINQSQKQKTYLISADEDLLFQPDICRSDYLSQFIEIYKLGQQQPNAFFVEAALAYLKQTGKQRAIKSPLDAARESLSTAITYTSEYELRQLYGNVADMGLVLINIFEQQCETLLLPAWNAAHGL
ncbi:exodeoxyribonuclease V subunit gamma [Methyloglobulus sp.]|uniref:exodeoxyribonuclease V subunit gamma n=1 Tax=Methyloglobulus sp. TaxID=2518622 RepID=UPI0032B7F578